MENKILAKQKIIFFKKYIKNGQLEKFEWLSSSKKTYLNTLHPKMTPSGEAHKPMLSTFLCTTQVLRGPFWDIWHIKIQKYTQTSIEPKVG